MPESAQLAVSGVVVALGPVCRQVAKGGEVDDVLLEIMRAELLKLQTQRNRYVPRSN
jgi:hypothetical protein